MGATIIKHSYKDDSVITETIIVPSPKELRLIKKCKFCKKGKAKFSKSFVFTSPICKYCNGTGKN